MEEHALRARTLIEQDDPRVERALRTIPAEQRPASPDAAYWVAALVVAQRDAQTEQRKRESPGCFWAGYLGGYVIMALAAAGAAAGLVWLIVWLTRVIIP